MKMLIYRLRLKNCLTQKRHVFVARCYLRTNPMGLFPKNCLMMKFVVFNQRDVS